VGPEVAYAVIGVGMSAALLRWERRESGRMTRKLAQGVYLSGLLPNATPLSSSSQALRSGWTGLRGGRSAAESPSNTAPIPQHDSDGWSTAAA
jgi:hypothetical protein